MAGKAHDAVMEGLAALLPRLWRYGLVLSGNRDTAEELVQATCVRAIERARPVPPPAPASTAGWFRSSTRSG